MSEEEREAAKAERRRVIENNKAWDAATTVRREWLAEFATRKTAPKGAEAYVAATALARHTDPRYGALAALGLDREALAAEVATCTPKRALQIALVARGCPSPGVSS